MPPIDANKVQWDDPAPQIDATKVQWDDAAEAAPKAEHPGVIGAAVRGFKRSLPETKMLAGGAIAAVGGALGLDGVRDYGLEVYRDTQKDVAKEQGPSFADVRSGKAGVGEYVGDVVGNFAGQGLQSAAAATVGAALGSEAPGVGNIAGAIGGVVAKGAIKRELAKRAEHMLAEQVAKGAVKEGGEAAARGAIERKLTRQLGAGVGTAYGLNAAQETGTIYGSRADDAAQQGEALDRGDAVRALGFGGVSGAVDTAAEALGVGRLFGGASGSKRLVKRVLAGVGKGALTEGGTEATQAVLERAGAGQSLTDEAARQDYLENFAAGAVGGGVLGAPSGVRRHLPGHDVHTAQPDAAGAETAPDQPSVFPAQPEVVPDRPLNAGMFERQLAEQTRARQVADAIATAEPLLNPDNGPLSRAVNQAAANGAVQENVDQQALAAEAAAPPAAAPAQEQQSPVPTDVPWFDPASGELRDATDGELARYLHDAINLQSEHGIRRRDIERNLWRLGVTRERTAEAWKAVMAERKQGLTAPAEKADATQDRTGEAAPAVGQESLFAGGEDRGAARADEGRAESAVPADTEVAPSVTDAAPAPREWDTKRALSEAPVGHVATTTGDFGVRGADGAVRWTKQENGDWSDGKNTVTSDYLARITENDGNDPNVLEGQSRRVAKPKTLAPPEGPQDHYTRQALLEGTPEYDAHIARQTALHQRVNALSNEEAAKAAEAVGGMKAQDKRDPHTYLLNQHPDDVEAALATVSSAPGTATLTPAPDVHAAAHEAATSPQNDRPEPTAAQKEAGNYKKGHVQIAGLDISIENPAGSKRRPEWPALAHHYGYIKGSIGKDKDHVDVFLTEHAADTSRPVFIIDQNDPKTGRFDEHKVILGVKNAAAAKKAYLANYSNGWKGAGAVTQMTHEQFEAWVRNPEATRAPASVLARNAEQAQEPKQGSTHPEFVQVTDVYGRNYRVRSADLADETQQRLQTYNREGKRSRPGAGHSRAFILRGNLDLDGSKRAAQPGLPYYAHTTRTSERPFKTRKQAETAVQRAGQSLENYDIVERGGGFVAVRNQNGRDDVQAKRARADEAFAADRRAPAAADDLKAEQEDRAAQEDADGEQAAQLGPPDNAKVVSEFIDGVEAKIASGKPGRIMFPAGFKHVTEVEHAYNTVRDAFIAAGAKNVGGKFGARFELKGGELTLGNSTREVWGDITIAKPAPVPRKSWAPSAESTGKIDDFGERLEGARKFLPPSLKEELGDDQIATQPLSKLWPADAHEGIEDPTAAALAYTARAEVPAKPRKANRVRTWVAQVKTLRALPTSLAEGADLAKLEQKSREMGLRLDGFFSKVRLLAQLPRETWNRVDRVAEYPDAFRYDESKRVASPFSTITIDGKSHRFDVGRFGPDELQAVKELLGTAAPRKEGLSKADFEIRVWRNKPEAFIARKGDSEKRQLKTFTGEDASKQARAFIDNAANIAELESAWEQVKARDNVGKAETRRDENRARVGENRRSGKDVTEQMFTDAFGFRGVQFGNWVGQGKGAKDRQGLLNEAYDALLDLADLLGIPSRAISLDGSLGLSLGARGHGKASAHFEPDNLVINLTKTRGAGSLAHEWFHALDNYFAGLRGRKPFSGSQQAFRESNYITYKPEPMLRSLKGFGRMTRAEVERRHQQNPNVSTYDPRNWEVDPDHPAGVRPVVEKAFADLVAALNASPMAQRAASIDGVKTRGNVIAGDGYWSRIIERGARSFENYVISKLSQRGWTNDFLANIRDWEQWLATGKNAERYPYLRPDEEAPIVAAFDHLFETLETKEGEGGRVALFSKEAAGSEIPIVHAQPASGARETLWREADSFYRRALQNKTIEGPDGPVVFSKLGRGKALSVGRTDALRMGVARQLGELAKVARVYDAQPDAGGGVVRFVHAVAPVEVDGQIYAVRMVYRESHGQPNGRVFYTFVGYEMSEPGAIVRGHEPEGSADAQGSPGSRVSLADLVATFKGQQPTFSRTGTAPARAGLDRNRAQRLLAQLTAKWGENAPRIRLVESAAELQRAAGLPREVLTDPGFYRAEGLYDGQPVVYLNLARIPTPQRFAEVLAHEALGHFGVERVLGKTEWQRIANMIQRHVAAGTGDKDLRRAIDRVQSTQPGLDADTFAREVVAVMAEQGARNGLMRNIVAKVLRFLRRLMPSREWSETEIRDLIGRADSFLRAGRTQEQRRALVQRYAFSSGEKAPVFHSATLAAIEAGKGAPKRADAAAWKGWLDGAVRRGDMKQSERDWLGLDDWLAKQDGPVTRDQLADFVRANQGQVEDVVLGGPDSTPNISDALNGWLGDNEQEPESADDWLEVYDRLQEEGDELLDDDPAAAREYQQMAIEARAIARRTEQGDIVDRRVKFENYQLPGGENYRELLLTLPTSSPDNPVAFQFPNGAEADEYMVDLSAEGLESQPYRRRSGTSIVEFDRTPAFRALQLVTEHHGRTIEGKTTNENNYVGAHFDQPNILAHVRFNERTDADGKKVLFIEEIQSDWHQQGRKKGYAGEGGYFQVVGSGGLWDSSTTNREVAERRAAEIGGSVHETDRVGVPDAPFKGTDEWAMLAFKRMVRWAAEHGFDRIAWTTGEQQADRYDLSKQVKEVEYINGRQLMARDKDGRVLINENVPEDKIEDYIGKDVAKRLLEQAPRHHSGLASLSDRSQKLDNPADLKVGGEGMRGFYDKILPSAVNKWAKKFGAKATETRFGVKAKVVDAMRPRESRIEDRSFVAHAIDLPPAMREAALAGQPLFSSSESGEIDVDPAFVAGLSEKERRSPAMASFAQALYASLGTDSPFFRNWFGESKVVNSAGEPIHAYHGTNEEFAAFDPARMGKSTNHMTAALGMFFETKKSKAEHYAEIASNNVPAEQVLLDGYLSIQNPYEMSKAEFMGIDSVDKARALRERLQAEGFDGIKLPDIGQWVAFKPEQFKLADNRGTFDPADRRMLFSKAAADTLEEMERDLRAVNADVEGDQSIVGRAKAVIESAKPGNLKETMRRGWLGALALRHLTQLGSDYFPTMRIYSDYLAEMAADRNALQEEAEGLAEGVRKWAGKNRAEAARMFDLMHKATIQGVDPAESYQPLQFNAGGKLLEVNKKNVREALTMLREVMRGRSGDSKVDLMARAKGWRAMLKAEPARRASYPSLVEAWNQLSPEAQQHYRAMRDMYAKRSEQTEAALIQRINDLKMEGGENQKRVLIHKIREQFESQRLQGVYFPLQRFGRYFVAAERNGSSAFLMYESALDLKKAVQGLRKRGFSITAQGMKQEGKAKDAPSGTFVAEVIAALKKAHVSEQTQDEIYQMYLQALPEMSMRKHSIHRKSVPGFDPDAVRAFAYNTFHSAHQLARLRYAHKLSDIITVLQGQQAEARKAPDADTKRIVAGDAILEELDRRHAWISAPQDSKVTNLVSSAGFMYYLGATPAAALVNLTQTALVSFPFLASRYGGVKAMTHLLAGMRDSIRTVGNIQRTLTDPEEVRAHQTLQRMGALDKTQAHNLAGIAEGGLTGYNPGWSRAMKIIGWGFHKTEVVNREATGLATYRLARAEGKSFDEAVRAAADAINETHFDYSNANRARYMQNGAAKVLLMFRQYSLNMTWHLGRMVWEATKGTDPLTRKIARRNLAGVLGMSALFSGVLGLPLMSVTMGLLNAIAATAGDDDEPWDAETEFRAFLTDMLGQDVASLLLGGAVNKVTGADIASRVSLSQLWFRDADRELDGEGAYYNLLEQAAGPMGGVLKNVLVGKKLADEGHLMRGVETMLPKSLKDMVKAARYATQGANTLRGDPIVADLSPRQTLLQLAGFTPNEVADRYDLNRSLKNYEQHILDRRQHLIDAYAMALRLGDNSARSDALQAIRAFNRTNREIAITPDTLRASLKARMRYSKRAENGIVLNPKLNARLRAEVEGG